jgi:Flp pilus assembly protein TadG
MIPAITSKYLTETDGTSLVEAAIVLPVLCLMLAGAVDIGRGLYMAIEVSSAANAGALYGTNNPSDSMGISAAASLDAMDVPNLKTTSSYGCECSDGTSPVVSCTSLPSCPSNIVNYVQVNTSNTYNSILFYPGVAGNIALSGRARVRMAH